MTRISRPLRGLVVFLMFGLIGCNESSNPSISPPPAQRDRLTAEDLMVAKYRGDAPVPNRYFLPAGNSSPALHKLTGTLTVPETRMQHNIPKDESPVDESIQLFPGFSVQFFTYDDYLVPVEQDILASAGPHPQSFWSLILSPGKMWSEPGDHGMSRASFPFVLVTWVANEALNGIATFLYDDTRASALRLQVVQEITDAGKNDFWGQLPLTYTPGPVANRDTLAAQFAEELRHQTPIRPWSELEKAGDVELLKRFTGVKAPTDISATGLIMDNTIYLQPCQTRYGEFPYCRSMRHGVYSATKSMGAAIALLRLAQKYGDGAFELKIKDYVNVTAIHNGWDSVTFGDCLNMATSIGDKDSQREPNNFLADSNSSKEMLWNVVKTTREKLDVAFSYGKYPWKPGEVARYNSTQTFVLAAAMDSFLKSKEGKEAHLWDMVVKEVFHPIGIFHAPMVHTQETDGSKGIPILAFGFYPTVDDTAKITMLLQNGGKHNGHQLLSTSKLAEALYKTRGVGLPTGQQNRYGPQLYHMSFWSVPYRARTGCFFQIPYMVGHGGNLVVLLPNGVSAFRYADGFDYDVEPLILGAEAVRPLCPEGDERRTSSAAIPK